MNSFLDKLRRKVMRDKSKTIIEKENTLYSTTMEVGKAIRILRKALGLTVFDFALLTKELGLPLSIKMINKIERCERVPSSEMLDNIETALCLPTGLFTVLCVIEETDIILPANSKIKRYVDALTKIEEANRELKRILDGVYL